MEGTPIDFGRLAVSEETDAVLRSMLDLFCDRQTYYKGYEDAMRCMLQCATTRTEEEPGASCVTMPPWWRSCAAWN